jgi:hypothetical protein
VTSIYRRTCHWHHVKMGLLGSPDKCRTSPMSQRTNGPSLAVQGRNMREIKARLVAQLSVRCTLIFSKISFWFA